MKLIPVGSRGVFATVDDEDYDMISKFTWTLVEWNGIQYAKRKQRLTDDPYPEYGTISMHSLIMKNAVEVDHVDGNGLNNQKNNLREVTHAQNIQNQRVQRRSKSGYRGVTYFPKAGKWLRKKPWRARIKVNGIDITLGYYATPEEAARRWNLAALDAWGEYARLNQILQDKEVGQR